MLRGRLSANSLIVLVALYLSLVLNLSLWRRVLAGLPDPGVPELGIFATLFLALNLILILGLALVSARPLLKPALVVALLAASVGAYFMDRYGIVIDAAMFTNVLNTDAREAGELAGSAFLGHMLLFGVLPALAVARVELVWHGTAAELRRRGLLLLATSAAFAACAALTHESVNLWIRPHRDVRMYANPAHPLWELGRFLGAGWAAPSGPPQPIGEDAVRRPARSGKPRIVVLVLGEGARAGNFSLLGYARETNPQLAAIDGLVSFSQVRSCATTTAASIPCMFSRLGRARFKRARALAEENVLDVLRKVGVDVLWRENNSRCGGTCARVPNEDLRNLTVPGVCDGHFCRDEVLLDGLEQRIARAGGDRLIVLHMLGSHGPAYYTRYPAQYRRFLPECAQDAIQNCAREAIVNAYDNSLLYTDHVLAQAIGILRRHAAGVEPTLLYVSDHGESLGEHGLYLHSMPYAFAPQEQKHVPLLLWSPALDRACLDRRRGREASHDNLFHTLLGLFRVATGEYREDLDLLRGCGPAGVS